MRIFLHLNDMFRPFHQSPGIEFNTTEWSAISVRSLVQLKEMSSKICNISLCKQKQ